MACDDPDTTVPLSFLDGIRYGLKNRALPAVEACWNDRAHLRAREAIIFEIRKIDELQKRAAWVYAGRVRKSETTPEPVETALQGRSKKTRKNSRGKAR